MVKRINNDFDILARIKHNGVCQDMSEYEITSITLTSRYSRTDIPDYDIVGGNIKIHITPKLAPRLGIYALVVSFRKADSSLEDGYWNFESDKLVFKIVGTTDEEDGGDIVVDMDIALGFKGEKGTGIQSVDLTSTAGKVKTYTLTFTDGTTTTFSVEDGADGHSLTWENISEEGKQDIINSLLVVSANWTKNW